MYIKDTNNCNEINALFKFGLKDYEFFFSVYNIETF